MTLSNYITCIAIATRKLNLHNSEEVLIQKHEWGSDTSLRCQNQCQVSV